LDELRQRGVRAGETTALVAEGRAAGIARASVVGVDLRMHRDVGVCSIGHDELTAVLLLRQQRGHARRLSRPSLTAVERVSVESPLLSPAVRVFVVPFVVADDGGWRDVMGNRKNPAIAGLS
jgi:hypothetical protein